MAAETASNISANPWRKLPLDSPLWRPIPEAHLKLCDLTDNRHLAAQDLTDAMANHGVPCMRRCFAHGIQRKADGSHERVLLGPDRELVPASHWTEHEVQSWSDSTFVTLRSRTPTAVKGYAYFVWTPALEKIWPSVFAPAARNSKPDLESKPERQPGPIVVKEPKDWFARACKDHPRHRGEGTSAYADRLLGWMAKSFERGLVSKIWTRPTMIRRLNDPK